MTIELRLTQDQERRLIEGAAVKDAQAVRQILVQAVEITVEDLLRQIPSASPVDLNAPVDFQILTDELNERLAALLPTDGPPLSDQATTREGIYDGHP